MRKGRVAHGLFPKDSIKTYTRAFQIPSSRFHTRAGRCSVTLTAQATVRPLSLSGGNFDSLRRGSLLERMTSGEIGLVDSIDFMRCRRCRSVFRLCLLHRRQAGYGAAKWSLVWLVNGAAAQSSSPGTDQQKPAR